MKKEIEYSGLEVAIIGLSCRVPGATNIDEFWDNLVRNSSTVSFFSKSELDEAGISSEIYDNPKFIPAKGILPGLENFDADFFKYTARDAANMDPQIRIMHEEVYHALEDAGYASEKNKDPIGVFIGAANNFLWELKTNKETVENGWLYLSTLQLNDKDFISSRIAYSLDLRGPSAAVHTACSTSLYAIDLAYRYIITGACPVAVAGGIGISLPNINGYNTSVAGAYSSDGYCRPFDKDASGTVASNGAAVVVLKSLDEAIRDGDRIYAVIKGTACNNDGSRKVGYTAPSVEGQAEVIKRALRMAQVPANSVSYVETHGTATKIGDPIELAALNKGYGNGDCNTIGVGSLKSNIGHIDTGAGAAAVVKTALSLHNKLVPATLHFNELNPFIEMEQSPFYVVADNTPLVNKSVPNLDSYYPLRAGVSAFGIGGTNVHMILEEAPDSEPSSEGKEWNTFCISANSEAALNRLKIEYIKHLKENHHSIKPCDLAWSLQTRQRKMKHRFSVAYDSIEHLIESLEKNTNQTPNIGHEHIANKDDANVYFLFPGHGSQYTGMSKDLYYTEPIFREEMDQCFSIIQNNYNFDMKSVLFETNESDKSLLLHADYAQLSLFIVEYCVAKMLIKWGIKPAGMIGHSLGEYVAACISEVFTLEDGISAIIRRGQLMNEIPQGAMISVNASADVVETLLVEGVTIAAINTHSKCTISGRIPEMEKVIENLKENDIQFISMESNHAAHSILMEPVREPLVKTFENIELKAPKIPYVSNLTGTWITEEEATSALYYGKHVRECVKFAHGIDAIMTDNNAVLIEVGPKKVLSAFAIQTAINRPIGVMNILPDQMEQQRDSQYIANRLGELWDYGVNIEWKKFYKGQKRKFVKLPYYPFEKTRFAIGNVDMDDLIGLSNSGRTNISKEQQNEIESVEHLDVAVDEIVWRKSNIQKKNQTKEPGTILTITDQTRTMMSFRKSMRFWRWLIASVDQSYSFRGNCPSLIRSANESDMEQLFVDLQKHALLPDSILIAESQVQNVKDELRVLLKILSAVSNNYSPEIIILSPVNAKKDYKDFIDDINCIKAEFKVDNVFLIGLENSLKVSLNKKQWIKILQSEISVSEREAVAVLYDGENRYIPEYTCIEDIGRVTTGVIPNEIVCISNKANRTDCATFCNELVKITKQKIHILEYTFEENVLEEIVKDETIANNSKVIFEPIITGANHLDIKQHILERLNEISCDGCFVWNETKYSNDSLKSNELEAFDYIIDALHDWSSTYNKNMMFISGIPQEKEWTINSTKYFMHQKREVVGRKIQKLFVANIEEMSLRRLAKTVKQMYQMKIPTIIIGANNHLSVSVIKSGNGSVLQTNTVGAKEKITSSLHEIWKTLFGRNDINIDSDFFRLGGDSFKIMQISEDIEKLGYKITMNEVYEYPTIRTLAEYLANKTNQDLKKISSIHEFEDEIQKQFGCKCVMRNLPDEESISILCIDSDKNQKKKIEGFLSQIEIPQELAPTYILTKDEVEKLDGEYTLNKMISSGILKESDDLFMQSIDARLTSANERLHRAVLKQPIESSYRIGTTQKMFLKGDSRLNLYSIDFNEAIDVELMNQAICDVIGRNGLLHSTLEKKGRQYQWTEYIPPVDVDIELFDISCYTEEFQKSIVSEIIEKIWSNMNKIMGVLMYRLLLLKWSEKRYELLFVFDHSIVDMISGQVIRRQINSRYEELKSGSRKASSKSIGYDYYLDYVKRGPIGVQADEIVEKLDLKNIYNAKVSLGKHFLQEITEMKKIQLNVDLSVLGMEEIDERNTFNIALQVFAKTVAGVLNVNELPFDLIYTNRTYGEMTFSDMVGPTVDAASFLVSVNDKNPTLISGKVADNMKYCVDNNMSFNNIDWNLSAIWRWRKIVKYMGNSPEVMGGQVLLNYAGQVEEEYDKIFERSIDLLDEEHQNKFDFGNFYVVSKASGNNLQFIIFTKVISDVSMVEESFNKAIEELKEYYEEHDNELHIAKKK